MTTEPYDESVREAVARETARRKRVLLAFMGFLLVPIAIGAYALTKAQTEIEKVASDVTPIVSNRVAGEISERVTNAVSAQTEPLIRQNVAREITTVVEPRLASVTRDITELQTTAKTTSEFVQGATRQLTAVPALTNRLSAFDADQDRLSREIANDRNNARQQLTEFRQTANANKEALASLTRQIAVMNRELQSLQARVKALENPRDRPVPR